MPEPRISILIVARDEAENLPGCLAAVRWGALILGVVLASPAVRGQEGTEGVAGHQQPC